ncbi:ABC transporter related [Staphylothermus marinus F1]|uniref:ABC transporter related n=1 Tax=Staphylothermus marinus (strain ATCC 43588 / DSM 3639 / JCM 9404 / F1) TaxID=399550 RepID=A3DKT5_STAMF|nr:ATP-binding cassette domain-containing protein [Staphylothermus marinus]ABN69245.1 ABC transporter related [Staphylothermus marinus F1]
MAAEAENQKGFFSSPHQEGKDTILKVVGISKRFPGVVALDNISLEIEKGTVHALLGENGAGKSTFVKILYGIYTPDEGEIYVEGRRVTIASPMDAISLGIVMVSQSPVIIDRLTVAENIVLGVKRYGYYTRVSTAREKIIEVSKKVGVKIDPDMEVWRLSYTQKQLVEIVRALLLGAKLLLLDEAITYLPLEEKKKFYKFIREYADSGGTVVLITHKIPEAMDVADKITVLRRGKLVGTVSVREATVDQIRTMMFGERSGEITYERLLPGNPTQPILEIKDLWVRGDFGGLAVQGVSLTVRKGEVVGIAGVAGNGQKELLQAIVRLRPIEKGKIIYDGVDITNKTTHYMRMNGVGYIPDLPAKYGVSIENNILENLGVLPNFVSETINWGKLKALAFKLIKEFEIKTPSPETPVKFLSGGNIMKVLVARELTTASKLLIAYNPTRGLDEATAIKVRRVIKDKVINQGIGALIASEDLDEVFQISDTIVVMNSGKIVGVFPADKAKREEVEHLMVM